MGISKTAGPDEIRKAYRKLAAKLHPDKETGDQKKVNITHLSTVSRTSRGL